MPKFEGGPYRYVRFCFVLKIYLFSHLVSLSEVLVSAYDWVLDQIQNRWPDSTHPECRTPECRLPESQWVLDQIQNRRTGRVDPQSVDPQSADPQSADSKSDSKWVIKLKIGGPRQ